MTSNGHPYREAGKRQASIFEDPAALQSWGHKAFELWAREQPMAPWNLGGILKKVEPRMRLVGRMRTEVDARKLVWRQEPYRGKARASGTAVDSSRLDAFGDPVELARISRYVSTCRGCEGTGQAVCRQCSGTTRTSCGECRGEGKVMGHAVDGSRRRLNCKSCKGKGSFACGGCGNGKVTCPSCFSSGQLEHWLEVEQKTRVVVRTRSGDADLRAMTWESEDVADAEIAKDAQIACAVSRVRELAEFDLPAEVPLSWRELHWKGMQWKLSPNERIASQRFQLLELAAAELTYGFAGEQQTIAFEGMRLAPPRASVDRLFHARASRLRMCGVLLAAVPLLALIIYAARGSYFLNEQTFTAVTGLVTSAFLFFVALCRKTLARPAKSWAIAALFPALGAAAAMVKIEPSSSQAETYLRAGLLDKAEEELTALGEARASKSGEGWQELYAQRALARTTCQSVVGEMGNLTPRSPRWEKARAHADRTALAAAHLAVSKLDVAGARNELMCVSPTALASAEGVALRVRIETLAATYCLGDRDWACADAIAEKLQSLNAHDEGDKIRARLHELVGARVTALRDEIQREKNVQTRLNAEREAIELWSRYLMTSGMPDPPGLVALRQAVPKDEVLLEKQQAREAKQRAVEEARAAASERKRIQAEERAQRAAEQAEARKLRAAEQAEANKEARWGRSPLVCNDGTYSPSCTCGRDSYRGCCSHHGGVSGCSAD